MTFSLEDASVHNALKLILAQLTKKREVILLHTAGVYSIYGIRRASRIAVLILSHELPLHRIEENFDRLSKDYFVTIYI